MASELRLLFVNYEYPPIGGGGGATTKFLAQALARRGHRIHVLTGTLRGQARIETVCDGLTIERIDTHRLRSDICSIAEMARFVWAAGWRLRRLLRKQPPDVLHLFFSMPTGAVLLFTGLRRARPYCISLLGGDVPGFLPAETDRMHGLLRGLTRRIWKNAAAVLPNSEGLATLARKTLDRQFDVLSNGVDTQFFSPQGATDDDGPLRLIFVGRLVTQKGISTLLEALAHMPASADYRLTIVGDGPLRSEMSARLDTLGISGRVEWKGWVTLDELRDLYRRHHALVLTSNFEGMASVMLQAMASGCAVISTDVFGAHDVLGQGAGGFIVPVADAAAFAEKTSILLNPAERKRLRAEAVERANDFSWDTLAQRVEQIYRSGLQRTSTS
jgi:glycosyltransferase involved in cell wall biosynthesis